MSPFIHTIRRVYGTCGSPNKPLVRTAHDCETGLFKENISILSVGGGGRGLGGCGGLRTILLRESCFKSKSNTF